MEQSVHLWRLEVGADGHITSLGSVPAAGGVENGESADSTQLSLICRIFTDSSAVSHSFVFVDN